MTALGDETMTDDEMTALDNEMTTDGEMTALDNEMMIVDHETIALALR